MGSARFGNNNNRINKVNDCNKQMLDGQKEGRSQGWAFFDTVVQIRRFHGHRSFFVVAVIVGAQRIAGI